MSALSSGQKPCPRPRYAGRLWFASVTAPLDTGVPPGDPKCGQGRPEQTMITKLIGIATLFAAGSVLPAAAPTLGAREIKPATMAPMSASPTAQKAEEGRCGGRRCSSGPRCSRRCASGPRCSRRCAGVPRCARRCGHVGSGL